MSEYLHLLARNYIEADCALENGIRWSFKNQIQIRDWGTFKKQTHRECHSEDNHLLLTLS